MHYGQGTVRIFWIIPSLVILSLGLLLIGGCDDDGIVSTDPHAPFIPSDPTPHDGSDDMTLSVSLSWTGADPDDDTLTYDVYFGDTRTPSLVAQGLTEDTYFVGSLSQTQTYHWRVVAFDRQGNSTSSPIWSFETDQQASDFIFPLALHNRWDYWVENSYSILPNDSAVSQPVDIRIDSATMEVDALVLYPGSADTAYRIDTDLYMGGRIHPRRQTCGNEPEGLIIYDSWGTHHFGLAPRRDGTDCDRYLTPDAAAAIPLPKDGFPMAMVPPKPSVSLVYPLEVGSRWTVYTDPYGHWRNDKEVMGLVTRTVPAGTFQCYEVRWFVHVTEDGSSLEGLEQVDYFAREGLVESIVRNRLSIGVDDMIIETQAHYKLTEFDLH
jgi:hypothetical protein